MASYSNHDDTNSSQQQSGGHGGRMGLLMALCCLAPLALILAVTVFAIPFSGILSFAALLLCPLMMVFMMAGGHGHGSQEPTRPGEPLNPEAGRVPAKTDIATW
jgi:DUF2933 family protein